MHRLVLRWLPPTLVLSWIVLLLTQVSTLIAGRGFQLGAYTSVQFALNTNAAALASTLGILIAIVLLMVQLTAQRSSFNIIGVFVKNPRNLALVALFIVTISFSLWLAASVDDGFVPVVGTYVALGMGMLCLGLLVPYFGFLFDSLSPHTLLETLQRQTLGAVDSARQGSAPAKLRRIAAANVQHTGDVTRTAISLSDADVARRSVWVLHAVFTGYLDRKPHLPTDWFVAEDRYPAGRNERRTRKAEENGTWFEQRVLEELQAAFTSSLNRLEPVTNTVSLCCRLAGEGALERADDAALRLLMKFLNTFLRAALNARDVRAGYHLTYQYALLADAALGTRPDVTEEIADRLTYYGETALGTGVLWMAVAAAQDLRSLAEAAGRRGLPPSASAHFHVDLLRLVNEAESKHSAAAGLFQKAALALGAFHLDRGEEELARLLARGLTKASFEDLSSLAAELAAVTEPDYWELTDRVINFDYLEEGPRARLVAFLGLVKEESQKNLVSGCTKAGAVD